MADRVKWLTRECFSQLTGMTGPFLFREYLSTAQLARMYFRQNTSKNSYLHEKQIFEFSLAVQYKGIGIILFAVNTKRTCFVSPHPTAHCKRFITYYSLVKGILSSRLFYINLKRGRGCTRWFLVFLYPHGRDAYLGPWSDPCILQERGSNKSFEI